MVLFGFEDKIPKIGEKTFIAKSAEVIGDVIIGNNCYIGFGAKIRGDYGSIQIGNHTSIQENCIIHAQVNQRCQIGNNVTIGHGAIIHGSMISNNIIIGMGAIIGDYAIIGEYSLIGAGTLVRENQVIEAHSLAVGVPAKVIRQVSTENQQQILSSVDVYTQMASRYISGLKELRE